jgi:hypothetical protein
MVAVVTAVIPGRAHSRDLWEQRLDSVVLVTGERTRGAGAILSSDGLVVTSTKAVQRSRAIQVELVRGGGNSRVKVPARIVARDDWFTLLQLEGQSFRGTPLGSTRALKLNDHVVALEEQADGRLTLSVTGLGAVAPLETRPMMTQPPLVTTVPFSNAYIGAPLFDQQGNLIGLLQQPMEGNFGGTQALRVEDIQAFLVRMKAQVPPRQLQIDGPQGMSVENELIPPTPLPALLTYRPGDVITVTIVRDGRPCGVLRPNTLLLEPETQVTLGRTLAMGSVELAGDSTDATVEVDGQNMGPLPLQLDCMGVGVHDVTARAPRHENARYRVEVAAGAHTQVKVALRKLEATLSLTSRPSGGEVWVSGELVGTTPLQGAAVPVGKRVVSVRFAGGARMRRDYEFKDGQHVDLGTVALPPPGALLDVQHEQVETLYIDGKPHADGGLVVLAPGSHTIQAKDSLGNVLTHEWEAALGGYRVVRFRGGSSRLAPVIHALGWVGLGVGLVTGTAGLGGLVGIPAGFLAASWAAGGILDIMHRQLWMPAVVFGAVLSAPLLTLGCVGASGGLLAFPWERYLGEGHVVAPAGRDIPLRFVPSPGWEARPVARCASSPCAEAEEDLQPHALPTRPRSDTPVAEPDATQEAP